MSATPKVLRKVGVSKDLAEWIRARLWAACIYHLNAASWDKLDTALVWEDEEHPERRRVLYQIYRAGYDPRLVKGQEAYVNLVEVADRSFPGSAAIFNSVFWRLITPPERSLDELIELNHEALLAMELFQATPKVGSFGARYFPKLPACKPWTLDSARSVARKLARSASLDAACILGTQFRICMHRLALPHANLFLKSLYSCLNALASRYAVPSDVWRDFAVLVEKRVLRNNWTAIDPIAMSHPPRQRLTRNRKTNRHLKAHAGEAFRQRFAASDVALLLDENQAIWPIVALDAPTRRFMRDLESIRIGGLDSLIATFDEAPPKRRMYLRRLMAS